MLIVAATNLNISSTLCSSRSLNPSSFQSLPKDSVHFLVTLTPGRETAADLTRLAQALGAVRDINIIVVEISGSGEEVCGNGMFGDILVRNRLPWTHIHANFEG